MPENSCCYYLLGACLEGEMRNPGLEKSWACCRLERFMEDFDAFVDRAEVFGLSEKEAARIWNARHHAAFSPQTPCPHPRPEILGQKPSGDLDCAYLYRLACLLRMPQCLRRCERFRHCLAEKPLI